MAAPTVRARTAPAAGLSSTSDASTQVGDLVLVFTFERVATSTPPTFTLQSNYAEITNQTYTESSTLGARLAVARFTATSSGANSYQAYTSDNGAAAWTGIVVVTTGTYDTAAIAQASTNSTTTNPPNPPSATLDAGRDWLVFAIGAWHVSAATVTPTAPTNYANLIEVAGSANGELAIADRSLTAAASEDPGAFADNVAPNGTISATIGIPNATGTAYTITCDAGSLALTGTAATVRAAFAVTASSGSMSLTGTAATVRSAFMVAASSGSLAITGTDASITHSSASGVVVSRSRLVNDSNGGRMTRASLVNR